MVFVEKDSFRNLRRLPTDAFRSVPRLPREDLVLPVAASDLVAWYPFRSGTGEDLTAGDSNFGDTTDYSAVVNGATFKPSGGVTDIKTGPNSGAFEFDGTDDALTDARGLGGTSITVLAQINVSNANGDFGRVYCNPREINVGGFNVSARSFSDEVRVAVVDANGADGVKTSLSGLKGQFGQVGLRYDGQTLDVIKNGGVANSTATTRSPSQFQHQIGFRRSGVSSERFGGIIDSLRVYNVPLSDSQINQIYLNTKP
jgi:hypothetical protein